MQILILCTHCKYMHVPTRMYGQFQSLAYQLPCRTVSDPNRWSINICCWINRQPNSGPVLSVLGLNKGKDTLFNTGFQMEQRKSLPLVGLNWGPYHGTKQALKWAVTALDNWPRWTLRKVIKKSAESSNRWPGPGEGLNAALPFMCRAMSFWHRHPWKKRFFGIEGSLSSQEDKN